MTCAASRTPAPALVAALAIALIVDSKRMHDGYRYPLPKIALIASTLFCSIFAWGFRSFGDAFFVVNLYHAVQYFAFVWATEKRQAGSVVHAMTSNVGLWAAFSLFLIPPLLLGSWFEFGKWHGPTLINVRTGDPDLTVRLALFGDFEHPLCARWPHGDDHGSANL